MRFMGIHNQSIYSVVPPIILKEAHVYTCSLHSEVQRNVYLLVLAYSWCLINGHLMISWVHGPAVWQSGINPDLGSSSVEQDVQSWLQDASLWNAVANTNELPHITRHILCGQMTHCGTGRAFKGNFICSYVSGIPSEKDFSTWMT